MKIALDAAKFSSEEANQLRKAMATFRAKGKIETLEEKMVGRMVARGYDRDFAQRCFDQIKGFGEYGFPESHAASFAHLVYVSSWLKWKYPAAFACALLNSQPMGFYAPAQIVRDAREHGVEVRAVDVNLSEWDSTLEPTSARPERSRASGVVEGRRPDASRKCPSTTLRTSEAGCLALRLRPSPDRGTAFGRCGASRPKSPLCLRRRSAPGRRARPCHPAACRSGCVPVDGARPAGGAVGFAGAPSGPRPAAVPSFRRP